MSSTPRAKGLVSFERKKDIGYITLNRPEKENSLDDQLILALDAALIEAEEDIDAKVIILRSVGPFSTGEDMDQKASTKEEVLPPTLFGDMSPQEIERIQARRARRWEYLLNFPRPTIAQVHRQCLGLGLNIAMCCDLVIASEEAVFGDRSVRMGLVPSLAIWPWLVTHWKIKEFLYLGRLITASEAKKLGLINQAVPHKDLEAEVNRLAQAIALAPADGLCWMKESLVAGMDAWGTGVAWRYTAESQFQASLAQRGYLQDEAGFFKARDKKGLSEAIRDRDKPFAKLDPTWK